MPRLTAISIAFAGLFMTSVASGQTVEIYADDGMWELPSAVELPAVGKVDAGSASTATVSVGVPQSAPISVEEASGPPVDMLRGLRVGLLTLAVGAGQSGAAGAVLIPAR